MSENEKCQSYSLGGERTFAQKTKESSFSGPPLGHADFLRRHLQSKLASHRTLLERIPSIPDLQSAWLILLFLCIHAANFLLRALPPSATREFAIQHDTSLRGCLSALLPLSLGGLGLLSAQRVRFAANWASWSDSLAMIQRAAPRHCSHHCACFQSPQPRIPRGGSSCGLSGSGGRRVFCPDLGRAGGGGSARMPLSMMTIPQPRNTGGSSWRRNQ